MGGQDDLAVGVQLRDQVDEPFLPFDVQAHLRLVHEEHIGQVVFHQDGEQDDQHLLLAAGELIGEEHLANLREADFVFGAHDALACLGEQFIDDVLKTLLLLRDLLGGFCMASLQLGNDAIAHVHLVVQVFALKVVELYVKQRTAA